MNLPALAATVCACAALAACADNDPGPSAALPAHAVDASAVTPAQCFDTREIRNHTVADDRTLYLNVQGRDVYRVEMANNCLTTAQFDPLVIRNVGGDVRVCGPVDLDIGVSSPGIPQHCVVSHITRLATAEIDALPAKLRP